MNTVDVYTRRFQLEVDPLAAFRSLTNGAERDGLVLFETAEESRGSATSFLVTKPAFIVEVSGDRASIVATDNVRPRFVELFRDRLTELSVVDSLSRSGSDLELSLRTPARSTNESERLHAPSAADVLRIFATTFEPSRSDVTLRASGAFAFDFVEQFEPISPVPGDGVDLRFVLPTELIEIDHMRGSVTAIRFDFSGRGAFDEGRRLAQVERVLQSLGPGRPIAEAAMPAEVATSVSDAEFGGMVERARRQIIDGEAFQVVVSRNFTTRCPDPLAAYEVLRATNPSPYMFYLSGDETLFGASPETSVRVDDARRVTIRPLAGTRRRGIVDGEVDPDLDARIEAELRLDEKEVAEHMMLVDLARNDVARVSEPGTRRVTRLLGVDRYSAVMHLVSHVEGELRHDLDALHAYVSTMNMGTLTGAPKVRAAQILRGLEGHRRGFYGGAVGYLTHSGELDTAIVIRSATVRDGIAHVRAGAGVVYDSNPAAEADETRRKAAAVLRAIGAIQTENEIENENETEVSHA